MLINYFDEYNIEISQIEEKLKVIENSKTENAIYISNILLKTLNYLFTPINLNVENIYYGMPQNLDNIDGIIIFDTILDNIKINNNYNKKIIIIGNHKTHTISENVMCVNIKSRWDIKRSIKNYNKVIIGLNVDGIDFSKYYYNKMRTYFLNILRKIDQISINELRNDTEKVCTEILINPSNFKSNYKEKDNKIKFKEMIKVYSKIIEMVDEYKIGEKYLFYSSTKDLNEVQKNLLNELSIITKIFEIREQKERISQIYDIICERMLNEARILNYCNFIENKCITMRYTDGFPNSKENGCCSNTYMDKGKNCRYLKDDYSCAICSISCRVFTCKYLQDRGIDHALWQYPLIDCLMGKIKKQRIVFSFFTPKEEMMKKL